MCRTECRQQKSRNMEVISEALIARRTNSAVSVQVVRNYPLQQILKASPTECTSILYVGLQERFLNYASSAQGVLLKVLPQSLSCYAFFYPCTVTSLVLRAPKSSSASTFPSEVQVHISNCLLAGIYKNLKFYLFKTEFTIFPSAPIPVPGSSVRIIYLNE